MQPPPSKGHFGISHFVFHREVVLFLEVAQKSVLCWEVVLFLEGPLSEVSTGTSLHRYIQGELDLGGMEWEPKYDVACGSDSRLV